MRLALATERDLPAWEVDDRPLIAALESRGAQVDRPVWDDAAVDWADYDAVLIRTTWNYQDKVDAFVSWVRRVAAVARLFNPAEVVTWNVHKSYLHDLQVLGAPVTPTAWLARGHRIDVAELCEQRRWKRGFLKPLVGSTARETLPFATDAEGLRAAQAHVDRLLPHEDLMLQPYLDTVEEIGELSLIVIDGEATHGVRKVPRPGDYRVQDDFGAHDERYEFAPEEATLARDVVELAMRALDRGPEPLLYARVDFLRDREGRLNLNELELVEPSLFFRHGPHAAERLADALLARAAAR